MKWIWLTLFLVGCSSLNWSGSRPNRFYIDKLWVRNTTETEHLGARLMHRFQPLLVNDLIIQGNSKDGVVAYSRDGQYERWRVRIKNGVEAGAVADSNRLYFGASDGLFYAIDLDSGRTAWSFPIQAEGLSAPTLADGVLYFLAGNNVVHALDSSSGKLLWVYTRRDTSNLSIRGGSRPSVLGSQLFVGFSDGFLVALKRENGTVLWESAINKNKRFRDVDAEPILHGDKIFISSYDGALYALNRGDGRILWSLDEGGYSAVTVERDRLYFSTTSGETLCADLASGKVLWRHKNSIGIGTRPVVYKDILIVGQMQGPLMLLSSTSGKLIREFDTGWGIQSEATVDSEKSEVYLMSAGANLYALRIGWAKARIEWP